MDRSFFAPKPFKKRYSESAVDEMNRNSHLQSVILCDRKTQSLKSFDSSNSSPDSGSNSPVPVLDVINSSSESSESSRKRVKNKSKANTRSSSSSKGKDQGDDDRHPVVTASVKIRIPNCGKCKNHNQTVAVKGNCPTVATLLRL